MIEGAKIVKIRSMTDAEYSREYWDNDPNNPVYVLELDNGNILFPSRDYEGNGGGALFGHDRMTDEGFTVAVDRKLSKQPVDTSHLNHEEFGMFMKNGKTPSKG